MKKAIITISILLAIHIFSTDLHQKLISYSHGYNLLQTLTSEKSFYPPVLLNVELCG